MSGNRKNALLARDIAAALQSGAEQWLENGSPLPRKLLLAGVALSALQPASASALALGELDVRSSLGQPFVATTIARVGPGELLTTACVTAATNSVGTDSNGSQLRVEVHSTPSPGEYPIKLTSQQPFYEPMYEIQVQISCPGMTNLTRNFMVLLNLPMTSPQSDLVSTAAPAPSQPVADRVTASSDFDQPAKLQVVAKSDRAATVATEQSAARSEIAPTDRIPAGIEYRVQAGDTLAAIARRIEGSPPDTTWQVAAQLLADNPAAFIDGNPNLIQLGFVLRIPDSRTLAEIAGRPPLSFGLTAAENDSAALSAPEPTETPSVEPLAARPDDDFAAAEQTQSQTVAAALETGTAAPAALEPLDTEPLVIAEPVAASSQVAPSVTQPATEEPGVQDAAAIEAGNNEMTVVDMLPQAQPTAADVAPVDADFATTDTTAESADLLQTDSAAPAILSGDSEVLDSDALAALSGDSEVLDSDAPGALPGDSEVLDSDAPGALPGDSEILASEEPVSQSAETGTITRVEHDATAEPQTAPPVAPAPAQVAAVNPPAETGTHPLITIGISILVACILAALYLGRRFIGSLLPGGLGARNKDIFADLPDVADDAEQPAYAESEFAGETVAMPAPESEPAEPELVTEQSAQTEPVSEQSTQTEPVNELPQEPEPLAEPVVESVVEPVVEPVVESVVEPVPEPLPEVAAESTDVEFDLADDSHTATSVDLDISGLVADEDMALDLNLSDDAIGPDIDNAPTAGEMPRVSLDDVGDASDLDTHVVDLDLGDLDVGDIEEPLEKTEKYSTAQDVASEDAELLGDLDNTGTMRNLFDPISAAEPAEVEVTGSYTMTKQLPRFDDADLGNSDLEATSDMETLSKAIGDQRDEDPLAKTLTQAMGLLEQDYEDELTASQIIEQKDVDEVLREHADKKPEA